MSGTPCFLRERRRFSRPPVGGRRRRRNERFYIGPKFCATVARRPPRLGAAGSAERSIIPAAGARPVCTAENLGVAARRLWERDRFRWVSQNPKTGAHFESSTQRFFQPKRHPNAGRQLLIKRRRRLGCSIMVSDSDFKLNVIAADSIPALVTVILVTPHASPRRHRPHRSRGS